MASYKASSSARRMLGLATLALGLVTLLLGLFFGYELLTHTMGAIGEGLINLAIFFSLLTGLGIVATVAGFNLLFTGQSAARELIMPWQPLVVSGVLILASMSGFLTYTIWLGQPMVGAAAKGVSLLVGLGLAFLVSGLYRRKQQPHTLFK